MLIVAIYLGGIGWLAAGGIYTHFPLCCPPRVSSLRHAPVYFYFMGYLRVSASYLYLLAFACCLVLVLFCFIFSFLFVVFALFNFFVFRSSCVGVPRTCSCPADHVLYGIGNDTIIAYSTGYYYG